MGLRTCARVAVRLCQHEHSFVAVWRSLYRRSGTRKSSANLNNNIDLQIAHRTWPLSHDVTWSRAIALLTAAPPRPPRIDQWPVYSDSYRRDAFLSTAYASIASSYCDQRQDNADEGLPQTADASTSRREQKQTRRHHAARAIDTFVLPSSDGHIDVKRRRWKRSQWVEHVQALQYLHRPQDAQAETSSPPTDAASTQLQLSETLLDCVHELRRVSIAKAGYSNWRMLDHVQLLVERFPQADASTQRTLLRLLGAALAQNRSRQLWLLLGRHAGAQRAIRRAAAPHVAAWRVSSCQRLWTLLARVHFRLLWRDLRFFEDTLTVAFAESMSPYTVCVAIAAAVRMRPQLQPEVWEALMRRVAATAADMDDTSAHETFRMFAHLAPPWREPLLQDIPAQPAAGNTPWHSADHHRHSADDVDACSAAYSGSSGACNGVQQPHAWAGLCQGAGTAAREVAPHDRMHGQPAAPGTVELLDMQSQILQESFDAFLGGSAGLPVASAVHELDGPDNTEGQVAVLGAIGAGRPRGAGYRRHTRVWEAEQLPERAWRAARMALEKRLQLSARDAAALRRQLRRASAADLQLNVWLRERMAATVRTAHGAHCER